MNVVLLSCTPNGDDLAASAAAACYASSPSLFVLRKAIESGHESVIEHVSFTFKIKGVSRALLAQLTRHRIASFSVESQRYVEAKPGENGDLPMVMPKSILESKLSAEAESTMRYVLNLYGRMVACGIPKEDARFILPNAQETTVVLTMNARELRHFFSLRCCRRAQWEIRALADEMLALCKKECPVIFEKAGPGCVCGGCRESRPCGNPRTDELPFFPF